MLLLLWTETVIDTVGRDGPSPEYSLGGEVSFRKDVSALVKRLTPPLTINFR